MCAQRFTLPLYGPVLESYTGPVLESYIAVTPIEGTSVLTLVFFCFGLAKLSDFVEADQSEDESSGLLNDLDIPSDIDAVGLIYARVSSESQAKEGEGVDNQLKNCRKKSDSENIYILKEFIDGGESGTSFDRQSVQELLKYARGDVVDYIIVDRISGLGRNPIETITTVGRLYLYHEVQLVTAKRGVYDLSSIRDQAELVMNAIAAGLSNQGRARAAWDTIEKKFVQQREWGVLGRKVPPGATIEEDDSWPSKVQGAEEVVTAMFRDFVNIESYAATADLISKHAGEQELLNDVGSQYCITEVEPELVRSVFALSDFSLDELDGEGLKRIINDSLYIGKIRYPRRAPAVEQTVIDLDYQIVDKDLREKAMEVVDSITERYSTSTADQSVDTEFIIAQIGPLRAVEATEAFGVVCPECGMEMNRNGGGERYVAGYRVYIYICQNNDCDVEGKQRQFPTQKDWEALEKHLDERDMNGAEDITILATCS